MMHIVRTIHHRWTDNDYWSWIAQARPNNRHVASGAYDRRAPSATTP